jgi:hypothetical protein
VIKGLEISSVNEEFLKPIVKVLKNTIYKATNNSYIMM